MKYIFSLVTTALLAAVKVSGYNSSEPIIQNYDYSNLPPLRTPLQEDNQPQKFQERHYALLPQREEIFTEIKSIQGHKKSKKR